MTEPEAASTVGSAIKGFRTLALNIVAGIPPLWDMFLLGLSGFVPAAQQYSLFEYIPDKWKTVYVVGLVGANVVLRLQTTTPVFQNKPKKG